MPPRESKKANTHLPLPPIPSVVISNPCDTTNLPYLPSGLDQGITNFESRLKIPIQGERDGRRGFHNPHEHLSSDESARSSSVHFVSKFHVGQSRYESTRHSEEYPTTSGVLWLTERANDPRPTALVNLQGQLFDEALRLAESASVDTRTAAPAFDNQNSTTALHQDGSLLYRDRSQSSKVKHPAHTTSTAWSALLHVVRIESEKSNEGKARKEIVVPPPCSVEVSRASRALRRQIRQKRIADEKLGITRAKETKENRLAPALTALVSKPPTKAEIRRLKNRASVQKCRGKKRERLDKLHDERDILSIENKCLSVPYKIVEKSGILELAEQLSEAPDIEKWIKDLLEGRNPLAFVEIPDELENENETLNEGDETDSSGESQSDDEN